MSDFGSFCKVEKDKVLSACKELLEFIYGARKLEKEEYVREHLMKYPVGKFFFSSTFPFINLYEYKERTFEEAMKYVDSKEFIDSLSNYEWLPFENSYGRDESRCKRFISMCNITDESHIYLSSEDAKTLERYMRHDKCLKKKKAELGL